jgi:AcrR family transcriptional regulator
MDARARVMRATVKLVSQLGYDDVSVTGILTLSEVSRRTFYSYFESVGAILAEVWIEHGEDWLRRLVAGEVTQFLDDLDGTLMELVAISHRVSEFSEVVAPSFRDAWTDAEVDSAGFLSWVWRLALKLGTKLEVHSSLGISVHAINFMDRALAAVNVSAAPYSDELESVREIHPQKLVTDSNETTEGLLESAVAVVGKVGLRNTNMLRICRLARVGPGAVKSRFDSPMDIVQDAFRQSVSTVVFQNVDTFNSRNRNGTLPERYAESVVAALGDARSSWRHFRREMVVASRHNPAVRQSVATGFVESDQSLKDELVASTRREGYNAGVKHGEDNPR